MSFYVQHGLRPLTVLSYADNINKTVAQIQSDIGISDAVIAFHNPNFIEILKTDCNPLKLYPEVCIEGPVDKYKPPPYYFKAIPLNQNGKYWFYVEVETQLNVAIDPIAVPISISEMTKLKVEDILLAFRAKFGYDFSDEKISMDGKILSLEDQAYPIIQQTRNKRLHISINVGDAGRKKICGRDHITAEIVKTEESYVNSLKMLEDYWQPAFKKAKIFEESELHKLFREIKGIYKVHSDFLEDLKKIEIKFSSELSFVFLKHLDNFTKAMVFVSAYKALDDMVKAKRSVKSVDKQFKEIEEKCPDSYGRSFLSFYITPVQRYPRYPLLFRELDKFTPSFHPEKEFINFTFQKLTDVNKHVDSISHRVLTLNKMQEIQACMPPKYLIIEHGRELIEEADVRIISKKSGQGKLLLFNDIILLCFQKKKQYTPIINQELLRFQFANDTPALNSLSTFFQGEHYQIQFLENADKQNWIDVYHSTLEEKYKEMKISEPFITWTDLEIITGMSERMSHDGCLFTGSCFFFGGINNLFQSTSTLIQFIISEKQWIVEETPVPARECHTITALKNDLYVCFGLNKKTGKVYRDIWVYRLASKQWSRVKPVNGKPIGRYGHSCVAYENKLYFFGGKLSNKKKTESEVSDQISVYDPENNMFTDIVAKSPNNISPPARYSHSATLIGRKHSRMVIIGGRHEEFLGDLWIYDFKKNKWSQRFKANVDPRSEHKAISIGRFLVVKGGIKDSSSKEIEIIDTKRWIKLDDVKSFGNSAPSLSKFSMLPIGPDEILVFGGTDRINHRNYATAWIANLSHNFDLHDDDKPIDRYWRNTNIDWFSSAAKEETKEENFKIKEEIIPAPTPNTYEKAEPKPKDANCRDLRAKRRKKEYSTHTSDVSDSDEEDKPERLSAPRISLATMEKRKHRHSANNLTKPISTSQEYISVESSNFTPPPGVQPLENVYTRNYISKTPPPAASYEISMQQRPYLMTDNSPLFFTPNYSNLSPLTDSSSVEFPASSLSTEYSSTEVIPVSDIKSPETVPIAQITPVQPIEEKIPENPVSSISD
ncbi:Kelch motif family protein [Trichomonas vaginalis G3]|uniref:Kelch motif family protein n=1 Tax=Trichomonas vaginalis (strain ATCC PRA-98 / G3) TaxID=412133 RepID=A2F8H3_TRIV3|nr:Rho guanyl-nucleotide exchange factor protein [Trichomonas vaginalis G3]EAX98766.1 Kelch motif family protein [Trichomonas vaginalis G3]KAI5483880.1 Rho guanyl-nucleotide exchange factor protein [Trichomonas vaginalis G3]|eukprot:XP_001311696.1 Kelch motif family protein [Trichomonas vaginalis G3]